MNRKIIFFIFLVSTFLHNTLPAQIDPTQQPLEARISRINKEAHLIRFRIRDPNMKFLNKGERLEFWNPDRKDKKCYTRVMGKTNEYLLVKVFNIAECMHNAPIIVGAVVHLSSEQFQYNLKLAKDLMDILTKKHQAIKGKLEITKRELETYIEKFEALNGRYEVLMGKLQGEWQEKLSELEEDRVNILQIYKGLEIELSEIEFKMDKYQYITPFQDKDQWMLESRSYNYNKADTKPDPNRPI